MKNGTGCLMAIAVSITVVIITNLSLTVKTSTTIKPPAPKQKLVDTLYKNDSIILIKIRKNERD